MLGDFNSENLAWWISDKTTSKGGQQEYLTNFSGYQQLISLPSHIISPSCFHRCDLYREVSTSC